MGRTRILVPKPLPQRKPWLEVTVAASFVAIFAIFWVARTQGWLQPAVDSVNGNVLETRIVLDHVQDSKYGGMIFYRLEAHVQYELPDSIQNPSALKIQDRWLIAYPLTTIREVLVMKQAEDHKSCRVYWIEGHPETAKCELK